MTYWDGRPASTANLRLFAPNTGWTIYEDEKDTDGKITFFGSNREIELAFAGALNAANLLLLTGAGSSFSAANAAGKPSAPSMHDLWKAVETAVTSKVMAEIVALIPRATDVSNNIEKLLTLSKLYVALFENADSRKVEEFIKEAEKAILVRADFVDSDTDLAAHRALIRKIARRGIRKARARIFTTNYDLCFERAAQAQQFVVIDGFSHSTPQVYDRAHFSYDIVRRALGNDAPDYVENVFHLYKLHGSIDWKRNGTTIVRSRNAADGTPVLIYPRDSKFQEAFETPYLDMMGAFQASLREPDTALIICGFGFNDDHISKPIMAALEANLSLKIIVCDVAFLEDAALSAGEKTIPTTAPFRSKNDYFSKLKALCGLGDKRLTLINGRFEDLSLALPDLVAQTERERHSERMTKLSATTGGPA